jgi:hypothetical protein
VFETPNAYVCERAVGEGRTCDFRSGRTILTRVIDRAQMTKLLETGKTDLLQFVSARTRRPFSAYLVKQPDGKVGFEFEAKQPGRRGARPARGAPLRVLGTHPRDRQPVELHAGRYGPYVKHGTTNATLPDKDAVDSLSLEQAVALVDQTAGRTSTATRRDVSARSPRKTPTVVKEPAPTTRRRATGGNGTTSAKRKAAPATAKAASTRAGAARKRVANATAKVPVPSGTKASARKTATTKRRATSTAKAPVTARKTTKTSKTQRR